MNHTRKHTRTYTRIPHLKTEENPAIEPRKRWLRKLEVVAVVVVVGFPPLHEEERVCVCVQIARDPGRRWCRKRREEEWCHQHEKSDRKTKMGENAPNDAENAKKRYAESGNS